MINIIYRNVRDRNYQILKEFRVGSWIQVQKPTKEDLTHLEEQFKLEPTLLADALDPDEVPRMEVENNVTYIFTRYPLKKNNEVITLPLLFVLGEDFVVTIVTDICPPLEDFLSHTKDFYTTQKTKLFLQLFSQISNTYNTYLLTMARQIRSRMARLEKVSNKDIVIFVNYERVLNDFHLALVRTNSILNNLLSGRYISLYEEDRELIEDIFISNDQLIETTKENLTSIVNIRNAYTTLMTNSLNRVIKFFTTITVLLSIPTLIASLYGMNVTLPFADNPMAFLWIMLTILSISLVLIFIFIKKDWL